MTKLYALNPRWQKKVERAYRLYREYQAMADDPDETETRLERKFDQFTAAFEELPKRERKNLDIYHHIVHGYGV